MFRHALIAVLPISFFATPTLARGDDEEGEIDVPIGVNPDGQLVTGDFDFNEIFGLDFEFTADGIDPQGNAFTGYSTDNPGFRDLISAGETPTADFAQLTGNFDLAFELISIDAPLRMADPFFDFELASAGDTFSIGSDETIANLGEIDSHPFFFIAADDFTGGTLSVTGRVIDLAGTYAASDAFTFTFAVPAPSSAGLLTIAGLAAARRRR